MIEKKLFQSLVNVWWIYNIYTQSNTICYLEWIDRASGASKRGESEGQSSTAVGPSSYRCGLRKWNYSHPAWAGTVHAQNDTTLTFCKALPVVLQYLANFSEALELAVVGIKPAATLSTRSQPEWYYTRNLAFPLALRQDNTKSSVVVFSSISIIMKCQYLWHAF